MNLPHRQGSTDLDRLDDAIKDAKQNYESQGLEINLFNSAEKIGIIF